MLAIFYRSTKQGCIVLMVYFRQYVKRCSALKQLDEKKEEHPVEFAHLAHTFEKLEKTSSRLALIAILAELFRLIDSPDEIEKVCYLLQGRERSKNGLRCSLICSDKLTVCRRNMS